MGGMTAEDLSPPFFHLVWPWIIVFINYIICCLVMFEMIRCICMLIVNMSVHQIDAGEQLIPGTRLMNLRLFIMPFFCFTFLIRDTLSLQISHPSNDLNWPD